MKKTAVLVLICTVLALFGVSICYGQVNCISGISTVAGSFSHNGFVPHEVIVFGGELVVSDKDNHRLSVVDIATGSVTMTYGGYGNGDSELRFPRGLTVYGKELLVCDSYNNRIVFLNGSYQPTGFLELDKEPKDVWIQENVLYILMSDGVTVEIWDLNAHIMLRSFSLTNNAEHIAVMNSKVISLGNGIANAVNLDTMTHELIDALTGAVCVNTLGDKLYGLFDDKVIVYDSGFNEIEQFALGDGGSYIYPTENEIFVASFNKALVYSYKDGNISDTFGVERRKTSMEHISADGATVAVYGDNTIDIYKNGNIALSMDGSGVKDIFLGNNKMYVLKSSSLFAYELVTHETEDISLSPIGCLDANSNYRFTSMAVADDSIYITEMSSGKVLNTGVDLEVFTTAVSGLHNPKAVAYGDGRLYVADDSHIRVFDVNGGLLYEIAGSYDAITYNDVLYAIETGGKEIICFSDRLEQLESITYEGYFLGLQDIDAKEQGIYICDGSRKEVMVFTNEDLDITEDNISIDGTAFDGSVIKGQTVKVRVSGAGMLNPLPRIGDVRYKPMYCGTDASSSFKEKDGVFESEISMQNVGNYTIKVTYQKQIYYFDGWRDNQSADGSIVKDIAITVDDDKEYNRKRIDVVIDELCPILEFLWRIYK